MKYRALKLGLSHRDVGLSPDLLYVIPEDLESLS